MTSSRSAESKEHQTSHRLQSAWQALRLDDISKMAAQGRKLTDLGLQKAAKDLELESPDSSETEESVISVGDTTVNHHYPQPAASPAGKGSLLRTAVGAGLLSLGLGGGVLGGAALIANALKPPVPAPVIQPAPAPQPVMPKYDLQLIPEQS